MAQKTSVRRVAMGDFDGKLERITVSVGGMSCAACVRRVETAVKSLPGVRDGLVEPGYGKGDGVPRSRVGGGGKL